jgi:ribosome-binding protein aMBF1 (putative translation factor)
MKTNIRNEIAQALKCQRCHLGLSLDELSAKSTMSLARIRIIEEGLEWPTDLEIDLLMDILNMSIIELAGCEIGRSLSRKLSLLKKDKLPLIEAATDGLLQTQKN